VPAVGRRGAGRRPTPTRVDMVDGVDSATSPSPKAALAGSSGPIGSAGFGSKQPAPAITRAPRADLLRGLLVPLTGAVALLSDDEEPQAEAERRDDRDDQDIAEGAPRQPKQRQR